MSVGTRVREKSKKRKKKKHILKRCDDNIFSYDIRDYDGFNDDPEELFDD